MITSTRFLIAAAIAASSLSVALPSSAHAATYAFVNTAGEVNAVVANDPMTALATAFNISAHSGVLLLSDQNDTLLNDSVSGI